jgi:ankyrin repeat protein
MLNCTGLNLKLVIFSIFPVQLLLSCGCSVNRQDTNGYSALHIAVEMGYDKIGQLLLQHRANVNAMDNYGISPLHLAAKRGDLCMEH